MIRRSGLIWDTNLVFSRFIEECGVPCEHVTPHMLAAPFFRGHYTALIVPTGFGHPTYSNLLPALRASGSRIRRFAEGGGRVLVFGAADDRRNPYDWLPFNLEYTHNYGQGRVEVAKGHECSTILHDYDESTIECDGFFHLHDAEVVATSEGKAVMVARSVGEGMIVVTCIHEYPSRDFIREFCTAARETLF